MEIDRTKNYQIYTDYFRPSRSKLFSQKKTISVREKTFFQNPQTQLGAPYESERALKSLVNNFLKNKKGKF